VIRVQAADPSLQIQQLEETIRTLNGKVEDMSFQLLQMQEQMRKTQEDNEFRFQELENGKAGGKSGALEKPESEADTQKAEATPDKSAPAAGQLGEIKLDANGNPIGATASAAPGANATGATGAASVSGAPDDVYQTAYSHVLSGDYRLAEQEFRDYLDIFPKSDKAADAYFWLGESQYSLGKYNEAAKTFIAAHKAYPNAPKAPESLLKLGMSLAALDNKDMACATMREVGKQYPKASKPVKTKVTSEMAKLAC
jgi:tol-pal system protein YbgF